MRRLKLETLEQRLLLAADSVGIAQHLRDTNEMLFQFDLAGGGEPEIETRFDLNSVDSFDVRPIVGQWRGDGVDRPGVVVEVGRQWHWYLGDPSFSNTPHFVFGESWRLPVVGDWDGDGLDNVGTVSLPSGAEAGWQLDFDQNIAVDFEGSFGTATGGTPIVGNWDGTVNDRTTSNVGMFRAGTTVWELNGDDVASDDGSLPTVLQRDFGNANDSSPIVGDWNGDGISNVGVVREGPDDSLIWELEGQQRPIVFGQATSPVWRNQLTLLAGNWAIEPELQVAIREEVIEPGQVVDELGSVAADATNARLSFEIGNLTDSTLEIQDIRVPDGYILESPQNFTVEGATVSQLMIRVDASQHGEKSGTVSIQHDATNLPNPLTFEITSQVGDVVYLVTDGFEISSEQLTEWSSDWSRPARELDPDGNGIEVEALFAGDAEREEKILRIRDLLRRDLSPFNVRVELRNDAPIVDDQFRTTIFMGRSTPGLHVASDLDVGNNNLVDLAFVQPEQWFTDEQTAIAIKNWALHEYGHTVGLLHEQESSRDDGQKNAMELGATTPLRYAAFLNEDRPLLAGVGTQNSWEVLIELFGTGSGGIVRGDAGGFRLDMDGDGQIGFSDFLLFSANFGRTDVEVFEGDFDGDGTVGFSDFLELSMAFGQRVFVFDHH